MRSGSGTVFSGQTVGSRGIGGTEEVWALLFKHFTVTIPEGDICQPVMRENILFAPIVSGIGDAGTGGLPGNFNHDYFLSGFAQLHGVCSFAAIEILL